MIQNIHQLALYLHIAIGSLALVLFWFPILTRKGSPRHKQLGKLFVSAMYTVSISGLVMSLIVLTDPIGIRFPERNLDAETAFAIADRQRMFSLFLLMLSILVFTNTRMSVAVLKARQDRQQLRSFSHLATIASLGLVGLIVGWVGFARGNLLLEIFSVLSVVNAVGSLHYIYKPRLRQREWIIAHLANIFGAGIAAYTAFFVFGGRQLMAGLLSGQWQILPWILPGIIGTIAIAYYSRKYRQQYHIA